MAREIKRDTAIDCGEVCITIKTHPYILYETQKLSDMDFCVRDSNNGWPSNCSHF